MNESNFSEATRTILLWGVSGMLLLSAALITFFVIYQRRLLEQQRRQQEQERQYQRELLTVSVDVQENERRRIASDLHDDIGSMLSAARLYLRQLSYAAGAEKTEQIKTESLKILDEMIQTVRSITHDLLPPVLEKFGFQAAAEELCERIENSGGIHATFVTNVGERLAKKQELALYRVLQELVSNTLKHAQASKIDLKLIENNGQVYLQYQDDGVGFDAAQQQASGLGLRNIESRISLINGKLESFSRPGAGLKVQITLPK